jgi:hypothetical protein
LEDGVARPLHVRVAEALGMKPADMNLFPAGYVDSYADIPRYDTDWSATGPLIEKYGICLDKGPDWAAFPREPFIFSDDVERPCVVHAATPLIAVCFLILALKEAGKL